MFQTSKEGTEVNINKLTKCKNNQKLSCNKIESINKQTNKQTNKKSKKGSTKLDTYKIQSYDKTFFVFFFSHI